MQTNVDSLKINYMDKGSGELVVLLHGWGSNIELFENMSELLARKYHVVAPDMPGFGLSDEPKEPWRVDDYVDFVLKFLEPFAPKKVRAGSTGRILSRRWPHPRGRALPISRIAFARLGRPCGPT